MLRIAVSGCGRRLHRVGKGQRPVRAVGRSSAVSDGICGRLSRMRIACPFSSGNTADVGDDRTALAADRLEIDRLGGIEHQPHRIGAAEQAPPASPRRRKTSGAAVAVAPGRGRTATFWPAFGRGGVPPAIGGTASAEAARGLDGGSSAAGGGGVRGASGDGADGFGGIRLASGAGARRCDRTRSPDRCDAAARHRLSARGRRDFARMLADCRWRLRRARRARRRRGRRLALSGCWKATSTM